jgi:hypothetical protein
MSMQRLGGTKAATRPSWSRRTPTCGIHLNPVRVGEVSRAWEFAWSSAAAYVGKAAVPEFLTVGFRRRRVKPSGGLRAVRAIGTLALAAMLGATGVKGAAAGPVNPYLGYVSTIYADPAHWLCRPDSDDVCDHDLDATVVRANGHVGIERWRPARTPRFDCFYVYPTISTDPGGNSDLIPGTDQELFVVRQQAARLGSVCRVFAPVYRQVTLTALLASLGGTPIPADSALANADILDAWKHYIANDNGGRGVLLIGHSQGASRLTTLIKREIDPNPELRDRLVSAVLLGTSFQVPDGADVGGDFANIPLCHSRGDTGCVITYASFRATAPPPSNSLFGRSLQPGWKAGCTNPALLAGRKGGVLHPYLPTNSQALPILPPTSPAWVDPSLGVSIATPFVTLPGFLEAACTEQNGFSYLAITVKGDPSDPRIDDITGADLTPDWGLHLVDASIAMGDLVKIAKRQGRAHQTLHK